MKCKICKVRETETTDGRCNYCIGKPEVFIYEGFDYYSNELKGLGVTTREDEKNFYKKVYESKRF